MSQITQTITEYTGDTPDGDTMTEAEFNVAAEAVVDYIDGLAPELNTFATQANALGVSANDLVTALAAAAFKGEWDDLTGALAKPACVYHDNQYWMLLDDLADVTASEPADANADWVLYPTGINIIAYTANHSVTSAEARAGNVILTNYGASGDIEFQLPARNGDYRVAFSVEEAHYVKIKPPAGEKIYYLGGSATATDGFIRSNAEKTYFKIIGSENTYYTVIELQGTVNVDE